MGNKIFLGIVIIAVMIAMTGLTAANNGNGGKSPGAVMAVDSTGDDTNLYPGTQIYIKGVNLAPNSPFSWEIYDMEAGCTVSIPGIGCGTLVNSGSGGTTDANGAIFPYQDTGWSIPAGDYNNHDYKLVVTIDPDDTQYADMYTKIDTLYPIPELSTIVLISAGIIGLFALVRLRKKD